MDKVFKIGLVYINTNNIGDIVIYDCTKHLIKQSLDSLGIKNYKIVPIDMGEKVAGKTDIPRSYATKQQEKFSDANRYVKEWKSSNLHFYFSTHELPKVHKLDMIFFAGGGLIKFHQQHFHMYIDEVTSLAEKYKIPVIFNAVGVEGYDEGDTRCEILKTALNRKCVKSISVRDSIELLREKYLIDERIESSQVCDPALWTQETYGLVEQPRSLIGLGVIRPEIFSLYGVEAPKEKLLNLYEMVITELERLGKDYRLFTNGARRDRKFIDEIREHMGRGEEFVDYIEKVPKNGRNLAAMINTYERVLTCRMHAAVIAYTLGIPAATIVWNNKLQYFAEATRQSGTLIQAESFDDKRLVLDTLLKNPQPELDEVYKNTDYYFIKRSVKRYYQRRFIVKLHRFSLVMSDRFHKRLTAR